MTPAGALTMGLVIGCLIVAGVIYLAYQGTQQEKAKHLVTPAKRASRRGFLIGFFLPSLYAIGIEVQSWAKPPGGDSQLFGGFLFFLLVVAFPAGLVTGGICAVIGLAFEWIWAFIAAAFAPRDGNPPS